MLTHLGRWWTTKMVWHCSGVAARELKARQWWTSLRYFHTFQLYIEIQQKDAVEQFIPESWHFWDSLPRRLSGLSAFVANYEVCFRVVTYISQIVDCMRAGRRHGKGDKLRLLLERGPRLGVRRDNASSRDTKLSITLFYIADWNSSFCWC